MAGQESTIDSGKAALTSLDLHFLVHDFQTLVGAKVDKIYQISEKKILVQVHIPSKGKKIIAIQAPLYALLEDAKEDAPERPSGFAMNLRKHLQNSRIRQVSQHGFERVLVFGLERTDETGNKSYFLIVELFSKGNILLCDENHKIISLAEEQFWKTRPLARGNEYVFPEKGKYNFLELTAEQLKTLLKESDRESVVKTLAIELSLGGFYAEQLCQMSGVDKNAKSLSDNEADLLFDSIAQLRQARRFDSYNEAFLQAFKNSYTKADSAEQVNIKKLERIIAKQKEKLVQLESEIDDNTAKADAIYGNYQLISEIIASIRQARKEQSWAAIKEKLKGHKIIKDIKEKEGILVLEL